MKSIHLIRLYEILTQMVKTHNLSIKERDDILKKAGLYHLSETDWKDSNGVIYTIK